MSSLSRKDKDIAGRGNSKGMEVRKATAMSRKQQVEHLLEQGSQSWSGIKSSEVMAYLDIVEYRYSV